MHKEHLEIAAIDAVAVIGAVDAVAAIRRGASVADMDRSGVVLQRRLSIEPGAIDGCKCFALQRCRATAFHRRAAAFHRPDHRSHSRPTPPTIASGVKLNPANIATQSPAVLNNI